MRTPITYYGGKQRMCRLILPLIPEHKMYVEPFFGGGAIFFAKEPSEVEVINDMDTNIGIFYEQLKTNLTALKTKIEGTLYSRQTYQKAFAIYKDPSKHSPLDIAWAFYVTTNQGWGGQIGS